MAGKDDPKDASSTGDYGLSDAAVELKDIPAAERNSGFLINPPKFKETVVPIIDPEIGMVIGFRTLGTVWKVYDIEGNFVTMEEKPLETPLLDPIDLIGGFGGKAIMMMITRGSAKVVAKIAIKGASTLTIAALRKVLGKFVSRSTVKFTAKTLLHMQNPKRAVPIQILQMAIKYGAKAADPQNVKGAIQYTIKMTKFIAHDTAGKAIYKEYTLEVVLREADNTILHFLYK